MTHSLVYNIDDVNADGFESVGQQIGLMAHFLSIISAAEDYANDILAQIPGKSMAQAKQVIRSQCT